MTAMSIGWCAACEVALCAALTLLKGQVPADQFWSVPDRNPYYKNEQRTAEPWLLHDFNKDFYGAYVILILFCECSWYEQEI